MTYSDNYNIRTKNVKFNDVADAIDDSLTRSYGGVTTGTSTAYIATPTPAWTSYITGDTLTIIPHVSNTGSATINVSGLGAKTIRRGGVAISADTFIANSAVILFYNGAEFDVIAIDSTTPSGTIVMTGRATAPVGWLLCNGQQVPVSTYSELSVAIGTAFNTGGETAGYFRVPNMQQRFPMGKAASGTGSTLGGTGGAIDHTHSIPAHYHGFGAGATLAVQGSGDLTTGINSVGHTHTFSGGTGTANSKFYRLVHNAGGNRSANHNTGYSGGVFADYTDNQYPGADHTHNFSGTTDNISQNHTHTLSNHSHSLSGAIGLVTGGVDGNTTQASGSNNPPFLVLNFIIKA